MLNEKDLSDLIKLITANGNLSEQKNLTINQYNGPVTYNTYNHSPNELKRIEDRLDDTSLSEDLNDVVASIFKSKSN